VKYLPIKNWIKSFPFNTAFDLLSYRKNVGKNSAKELQQKISFLAYKFAE
jgi:hypothetical protein